MIGFIARVIWFYFHIEHEMSGLSCRRTVIIVKEKKRRVLPGRRDLYRKERNKSDKENEITGHKTTNLNSTYLLGWRLIK